MADQTSSSTVQPASDLNPSMAPSLNAGVTGGTDTRPTVRIEAEDGVLSGGFSVERGTRIATSGSGEATYDLSGVAAGSYLVRIGYWDENDGASSVGVTISSASAGTFSGTLALDEATASGSFSSRIYRETTLDSAYMLGSNGLLKLSGLAQGREIVRVDYIELIPAGAPPPAGNQAPSVSLANALAGIPENADTGARIKVADIVVTDDGQGSNTLGLAGADAALFEIDGTGLFLKAGTALDALTRLDVTVTVDDAAVGGAPDGTALLSLPVTNAGNAAPVLGTAIVDQTVDRGAPVTLDVRGAFTDPDGDTLTYTVAGGLPAGVSFANGVFSGAVEAAAAPGAYEVTVTATDATGSNTGVSDTFVLNVTGVTGGTDTRPTVRIEAEDGVLSGGFSVERGTRIATSGSGEATYDLSGVAAGSYLVRIGYWDENDGASSVGVTISSASAGTFSGTLALDEATASGSFSSRIYRETTLDSAYMLGSNGLLKLSGLAQGREIVRVDYIELIPAGAPPPAGNQAPSVSLANALAGIPENADTGARIKVADIVVTDDGQGSNTLGLAGADAALFEIDGTGLFLKAGTALDALTRLDVTVTVDDAAVGGAPDGTALLSLPVTNAGNAAPVLGTAIVDQTVDRGAPVTLDVRGAFTDPDGDTLTYTVAGGLPAGVSFANGVFSGAVEAAAAPGAYEVTVTATDATGSNTGVSDTFVLNVTGVTGGTDTRPTVRIEAEDGVLSGGFSVERGTRIATSGSGEATYDLSGVAAGSYLVRIGYWDENDGASSVGVTISSASAGTFSGTLALDEATASGSFSSRIYRETTLDSAYMLGSNGLLKLSGLAQGREIVRVDYIELIPAGAPPPAGNQAPSVSLANALAGIPENADTGARIKVADIVVTDDGQGSNTLGLAGADAALFEIEGLELFLRAGTALDFETRAQLSLVVEVDNSAIGVPGSAEASANLTIAVTDVAENQSPTAVTLSNVLASIPENATGRLKIADITINDDGLGSNTLRLAGADAALFEIEGLELFLRAGTVLDFETRAQLSLVVEVDDPAIGAPGSTEASADLTIAVTDVAENQAPTAVTLSNVLASIPENATGRLKIADITISDDGLGSNTLRLAGADAALFEIDGLELFLRAGTVLDFETRAQLSLVVEVDDPAIGAPGSTEASADLTIAVTDVAENQAPTAVTLSNVLASIPENATGRLKIADITISDDGLGSNTLRLAGADAALFEIDGLELFLRAGTVLDFETRAQLSLVVEVDDPAIGAPGSTEASADLTIAVTDVVETWGNITLDGVLNEWDASTRLAAGSSIFSLHGTSQGGALVLGLSSDGPTIGSNTTFWFNTDLDPLTGFQVFGGTVGAEYNINIGPDGTPALYTGAAGEQFVANLDYVFNADRTVLEIALPSTLVGGATKADLFADVNDTTFLPGNYFAGGLRIGQNEAPTVSLTPILTSLLENADTRQRIKVADIQVTDDGIGTNELRLSGADATLFEIDGFELYLKANVALDHETNSALEVNVLVDDPTLGVGEEASVSQVITVGDVDETWGAITLDGSTGEWSPASILATQTVGSANYTVRGIYQDGAFVMAIEADGGSVGANTTIWLNTDLDTGTGYQVFGTAAGAEYNINFGPDGTPALYTGADGQTFVASLDHVFNADRSAIELALPSSLAGDSRRAEIYVDVNNGVFLPGSYTTGLTFGEETPLLPVDPTERVAIVYSETSADFYFDKTSYGQLFMAAQHQAMQAGIPFDILSENDLVDIANIAGYDAIVFPGFSHVPSSLLPAVTNTLTSASQDYNIGMVAMGNFLTNDETGAAISGDSYARMKSILGVTLESFGTTDGVTLRAETGDHPVSDLYAPDEVVGSYGNTSFQNFRDVSGGGQTLFTQTVNGQDLPAVIATTTGGRNVHFATDAVFGNNNILHEAMKWSAQGSDPEVMLQMTRGSSLFFSRNDMDQSQEVYDVSTLEPGIYDEMIPIIEQWYQDYGFVGSYYINVGADPAEFQGTDWSISRPYYQRIMALESEIGTHSYTHPADTNELLPDVITEDIRQRKIVTNPDLQPLVRDMSLDRINEELAAALAATNPAGSNPVPRSSLGEVQQALLEYSLRFQFDYSRQIIERELGLENLGAAVPGAPEKMDASFGMLEYLSYLTGGFSGVGAGYPGAFGFLDPDHTDKVYFAPNVSFDFSLIEFQNLSPEQAEARWAGEFDQITSKGSTPIIHFPWHDYGPTNWTTTEGQDSGYTREMFTNFVARAYRSGTEFVTGADLARRIESFAEADLQIDEIDGGVRATVSGSNLGTFALELEAGQRIADVGSWYAFSDTKVFVDRNGGTFDIVTGAQVADVTHIDALPMRADLISVSGDGTELDFVFFGQGEVGIDLKAWGERSVVASGASSGALSGENLTLDFDVVGSHRASIDYQTGDTVIGTTGDDVVIGSDGGRRIDGGGGNDTLFGASGADMFVFGPGVGSDVIMNFDLGADRIELVGTAFASTAEAYESFTQTAGGTELVFSPTQKLLLADVLLVDLQERHLLLDDFLV